MGFSPRTVAGTERNTRPIKHNATDPDIIDKKIKDELERLTSEDSNIWTASKYDRRDFVHSFFQYPAMMVPIVQKRLIETIIKHKPDTLSMLDPFMGSATSIMAGMQCGLNCTGQDINPLAILLSKVKCGPYYYVAFNKKAHSVLSRVREDKCTELEIQYTNWRKWFREDVAIEISKLVRSIRLEKSLSARRLFWITLAEVSRLSSNDRTSTFKLHARPIEEIESRIVSPINLFERLIFKNIEDIERQNRTLKTNNLLSKGSYSRNINIRLQDSRKKTFCPKKNEGSIKYDLLVSSSPYGDNQTTVPYGQHAFLALQWLDLADIDRKVDNASISTTGEIDKRSLGGRKVEFDELALKALLFKSPTLKKIAKSLTTNHADKIDKVLCFVNDFDESLDQIVESLNTNAYLIWTMGNRHVGGLEIENDNILIELLKAKNCALVTRVEREILNKRMAQRNNSSKTMNMEDILIFRKIG
ncbi:MAG: hypothetical protein KBF73_01915 [Flavobacteriales bacterium]|nr:hypothetical protein [Flavobacteriales bacterium]